MSKQAVAKLRLRNDMRCSTLFTGEFYNRSKNVFVRIMENGNVISLPRQQFDASDSSGTMVLVFNSTTTEHDIEFDLSDITNTRSGFKTNFTLAMDSGREDFKKFITALVNHPDVECKHLKHLRDESIPKSGNPNFELEVPEFIKKEKTVALRDIVNVQSQIAAMTHDERRSLCYFFGFSPLNLDNDDVMEKLLGLENGAIRNAENLRRFKEVYCSFGEAEEDAERFKMMMNVKKAVVYARSGYGPLQDKGVDGFWRGTEFIGRDEDSIVAYLSEHQSMYKTFFEPTINEIENSEEQRAYAQTGDVSDLLSHEQQEFRAGKGGKKLANPPGRKFGRTPKIVPEGTFDDDDQ